MPVPDVEKEKNIYPVTKSSAVESAPVRKVR